VAATAVPAASTPVMAAASNFFDLIETSFRNSNAR
jgi:hypothetical protein